MRAAEESASAIEVLNLCAADNEALSVSQPRAAAPAGPQRPLSHSSMRVPLNPSSPTPKAHPKFLQV